MLEWTTDIPTETDWYWWRKLPSFEKRVVQVQRWPSGSLYVMKDQYYGLFDYPEHMGGEWAGPIPEPTERTEG